MYEMVKPEGRLMLNRNALTRSLVAGASLLALFATQSALAKARDFPIADHPELVDHFPPQIARFPAGVTGLGNVVYATIPGYRPLIVDIYMPPKAKAARPLILFIHGGGWVGGHTRHSGALADFPKVLASLAAEGFVVASLEYRLSGEAPFPAQVQDARAALRFLKTNATTYGIDTGRTGIWGGSAGGHLTALTALSCGDASLDVAPAPAHSECVQAAVTWYGVFDFAPMLARPGGDNAGQRLLGCSGQCDADKIRRVSPVSYIDAKDPPFLLIHGTEDKTVNVSQSHLAEAAMRAAGVQVESLYLPGVDHSFIGKTPAETRAATLQATNATFDFFHKTLGVKVK
jgi:acetyl esterase/lipase